VKNDSLGLDYVGVKVPMFSFSRLVGADPMLGVEMMAQGEVGCFGDDLHEAFLHGLLATGFRFPSRGILLSLGPVADKYWFADEARVIVEELKLAICATPGTAEMHSAHHRPATRSRRRGGAPPKKPDSLQVLAWQDYVRREPERSAELDVNGRKHSSPISKSVQ